MSQAPESKLNINPELTPHVLPNPSESSTIKDNGQPIESTPIKPKLTVVSLPTTLEKEVYPPLEINTPVATSTPVSASLNPLLDSGKAINSQTSQELQEKPVTLEDFLNVVRSNLYVSQLTPEIEDLIAKYVDAYHTTLDYCLKTPMPEEEKVKELELLSGPINEIYNPNNSKLFDGNNYPAVELILNKVEEYAEGLEKGFTRIRMPANASASQPEEQTVLNTFGYLSVLFIFIAAVVFSIALGYILFILKK